LSWWCHVAVMAACHPAHCYHSPVLELAPCPCGFSSLLFHPQSAPQAVAHEAGGRLCVVCHYCGALKLVDQVAWKCLVSHPGGSWVVGGCEPLGLVPCLVGWVGGVSMMWHRFRGVGAHHVSILLLRSLRSPLHHSNPTKQSWIPFEWGGDH
jgi:hypothetical protein